MTNTKLIERFYDEFELDIARNGFSRDRYLELAELYLEDGSFARLAAVARILLEHA